MKILVIGGMHGDEPLGIELVKRLRSSPIKNIDAIIANPEAKLAKKRFTGQDLNRSFPGSVSSTQYELRRAAKLTKLSRQYDLVLDFHNTYCPDNDCSFVGQTASELLYRVSGELGLTRVIVADYDCINKYVPNCISVEISLDSPRNNVDTWVQEIKSLSEKEQLPQVDTIETFAFVYRMTNEDRDRLELATKNFQAFRPIDPELANKMGVQSPAYPIFIGDGYTQYNYGGLLNKLQKS